ncbi:MAG TPA: hypothetical protein VFW11_01190 [Cyclobacteriaceae bacterium]|nr:hypothetical protein [Cyclobacteriaceae bacterium]
MKKILILFISIGVFGCKDYQEEEQDILKKLDLPEDVAFTYLPTELSGMGTFGAIGQVTGIPKGHGGFILKTIDVINPSIPVYAMSDGIIFNIRWESATYPAAGWVPNELQGTTYDDFALEIALSKTAKMHYGHLSTLSSTILSKAGALKQGRGVENRVEISFKAGEIIAYIGRHPGFDIGLNDTKHEHFFANPDRYPIEYRSYIPFTDYLPANLRDEVWTINPRTVEPRGGKIDYDVAGTLSGNWFLEGTTSLEQWSRQLIFARHELKADKVYIADGSPLSDGDALVNQGKVPNLWFVFGNTPLPETVTPASGKIKYSVATWWKFTPTVTPAPEGTLMVEMIQENKLKFEWFPGKTPDEVLDFTQAAKVYER